MRKRRRLAPLLPVLLAGLWFSPAQAQGPGAGKSILPAQRIIVFQDSVTPAEGSQIVQKAGGRIVHHLRLINAIAAQFEARSIRAAESSLRTRPEIVRIETDFPQKWIESRSPSWADAPLPDVGDVIRPLQWSRRALASDPEIPWGVEMVNAPAAWTLNRGAGVKVAVIDTGIDYDHPDLRPNVKGGWNATDAERANDFKDDHGHGTHVAGTVAAVRNSVGVAGVAPEAELYGVKVLDAYGSGTFADVIAGIDWAVHKRMDVANMSLGASVGTESLAAAVKAAAEAGVAIIAAAGNSGGSVGYPAFYPEAIAISALDSNSRLAWFSSRGPQVAFAAPGVDVYSTYLGGGYETLSGTSMACPHVAGLAALAISAKGVHGPAATRAALGAAATALPELSREEQGAGLVDAVKLLP